MENEETWESAKQKLLGEEIIKNLNFDDHVISLCNNMGIKTAVLAR